MSEGAITKPTGYCSSSNSPSRGTHSVSAEKQIYALQQELQQQHQLQQQLQRQLQQQQKVVSVLSSLSKGPPLWKIKHIIKHTSFHGIMTKREAELKLQGHDSRNCYLTRYDEAKKCCYLAVKFRKYEYDHFALKVTRGHIKPVQYELKEAGKVFDKISDLLHFYESNQVSKKYCIGTAVPFVNNVVEEEEEEETKIVDSLGISTWRIQHIMMTPSFHRKMSRKEAELKLKLYHSSTCYLTRFDASANRFYLSVKTKDKEWMPAAYYHFVINITKKCITQERYKDEPEYELEGTEIKFDAISELLTFFKAIPINFEVSTIGDDVLSEFINIPGDLHQQVAVRMQSKKRSQTDCVEHQFYRRISVVNYKKKPIISVQGTSAIPTAQLKGIMEHPSYHGAMTGAEAESKLKEHGGNCYLTRYSTSREQYSLSVARNGEFAHFDLIIMYTGDDYNIYEIDGTEMQSKDIFSLLNYYKTNPLTHTIDSIGDPLLSDPFKTLESQSSIVPEDVRKVFRKKSTRSSGDTPNDNLSHPSLSNLTLITYDNVEGSRARVSIIAQLDSRWHDLGLVLGQPTEELERYKTLSLTEPSKYPCCKRVFSEWLNNPDCSNYPATWAGICDLLKDMEFASLVTKLQEALRSNDIAM